MQREREREKEGKRERERGVLAKVRRVLLNAVECFAKGFYGNCCIGVPQTE